MKINSMGGFFFFEERKPGQVSQFMRIFKLDLVRQDNYYTFTKLANAPRFAIQGATYLGAVVTKTYEGSPWEIMEANNLVYDFTKNIVVPISSISHAVQVSRAGKYFVSTGLILPGSLTDGGKRVKDYAAWYLFDSGKFQYSEVSYV